MNKYHKNFTDILQLRRFGGDLQGIINKLDYLSDLGINAIYLNPINDAGSLHKYDARHYNHVDVNFGPDPEGDIKLIASEDITRPETWQWTAADKLFLKLIDEVHKRGMRIILDYSWNHTGTGHPAWKDLVNNQKNSAFTDWYAINTFDDPATQANEFSYAGWANVMSMPEIKKVDVKGERRNGYPYEGNINEGAKKHIFDVTRRWLAPDGDTLKGIDGYRLDVADQIPMGFWREFRKVVKSTKPNAYLVGEIWWIKWPDMFMNPTPYVNDSIFDAVMFYQVYRPARSFFAKNNNSIDANQFKDSLLFQWNRIPEAFLKGMMNVSTTHDSPRLLTCFGNPGKYKYNAKPGDDPLYKTGKPDEETYARARLYLVHQFTTIGAPQIWNGEEMGMWGSDDPDCRKPLWWKDMRFEPETRNNFQPGPSATDPVTFNQELFEFYKKLIAIRKSNPVLATGEIEFITTKGKLLVYRRFDSKSSVYAVFNAGTSAEQVSLPQQGKYKNLLTGEQINSNSFELQPMEASILQQLK
jgi:glycosidase